MTDFELPPPIIEGANLAGNEYGWQISAFPNALDRAQALGYACIGGQFQFRLDSGTYEMYWLSADSNSRAIGEPWRSYCERSCSEVKSRFEKLVAETDFRKQAGGWPAISEAIDALEKLVFVAYFVSEAEWLMDERRALNMGRRF